MSGVRISQIFTSPVKSGKLLSRQSHVLTASGFVHDRHWVVVDNESGKMMTQRQSPFMAMIEASLNPLSGETDSIYLPGAGRVMPSLFGVEKEFDIHGKTATGLVSDDNTNQKMSTFMNKDVSLVAVDPINKREQDPVYAGARQDIHFQDGFAVLVVNQSSVDKFNERSGLKTTASTFRPNIVLDGLPAFAEDRIRRVQFHHTGVSLEFVKPCTRCSMPDVDQETGQLDQSRQVTKALQEFRRGRDDQGRPITLFGMNAIVRFHPEVLGLEQMSSAEIKVEQSVAYDQVEEQHPWTSNCKLQAHPFPVPTRRPFTP